MTRNWDVQDPQRDNRALPVALLVQVGIGYVFLWVQFPASRAGQSASFGFSPLAVLMLAAIPWIFYMEDIYL